MLYFISYGIGYTQSIANVEKINSMEVIETEKGCYMKIFYTLDGKLIELNSYFVKIQTQTKGIING